MSFLKKNNLIVRWNNLSNLTCKLTKATYTSFSYNVRTIPILITNS